MLKVTCKHRCYQMTIRTHKIEKMHLKHTKCEHAQIHHNTTRLHTITKDL
jgi:hypothetical protein